MQILEANKITSKFPQVIEFIKDNDLIAEVEVRMKSSIWGAGSRTTIYNALAVRSWNEATVAERVILWECFQMMSELQLQLAEA